MADPRLTPNPTPPQVGDHIWADRYDEGDWFGPRTNPIALLPPYPPFVDASTYRRYRASAA